MTIPSKPAPTLLPLSDGRTLAFVESGDPAGTPVFGFHGTPGSHRQLLPAAAAAARVGVRLILPDRPGYGASSFQRGRRLLDWPDDVARIADSLGLQGFGVFGVSGGGPHALVCAFALGQRLLGTAVVSGVGPVDQPGSEAGMMRMNRLISRMARRAPWLLRPLFSILTRLGRVIPERTAEAMARGMVEPDRAIVRRPEIWASFIAEFSSPAPSAAAAAAQDFQIFARTWGFRLEDVGVPVHLWQGDADVNVPSEHARMQARALPDAKLHEKPGEAHLLAYDHIESILRIAAGQPG